jgi:hypothetical protein
MIRKIAITFTIIILSLQVLAKDDNHQINTTIEYSGGVLHKSEYSGVLSKGDSPPTERMIYVGKSEKQGWSLDIDWRLDQSYYDNNKVVAAYSVSVMKAIGRNSLARMGQYQWQT